MDHAARQVDNLDWLPHIQHEHLAVSPHRTRLDNKLCSLRNRHEVPDDIRVRHRHRPTGSDLRPEQRHHRAARTEHVAEADDTEAGPHAGVLGERLQTQLRHPLAGTHDIGRPHGLVGGDQHERVHIGANRGLRGDPRTDGVVQYAFRHIEFDDRHMLVGGSMVNGLHAVARHDPEYPIPVLHRAEYRDQLYREVLRCNGLLQFVLKSVQGEFRLFIQHQARRLVLDDLPAELGPDGAAGPRHHDALAGNVLH